MGGQRFKSAQKTAVSGLTEAQADALCVLLDSATEHNWPTTVARLKERGVDIQVLRVGWAALEAIAGVDGGVPDVADFDQ